MILAHRIQLDPTVEQANAFSQAAGCARYTWNWALAESKKYYEETGKTVNFGELKKRWNKEKPEWVYDSPKDANQMPFANLQKAYSRFFNGKAKLPVFKSKRDNRDSFYISNDKFYIKDKKVKLPKVGWVRLTEELRFDGKILSATVSKAADRWFLSVQVSVEVESKHGQNIVGIDLGLKHFATLSSGEVIDAPKPLKNSINKLKTLSRKHSRKQKGSKNRAKSAMRLARYHARVTNVRKDFLHKVTSNLVAKAKLLVIEDLSIVGMSKMWGLSVSDLGLSEFRRQLEYKCKLNDCGLIVVDRWFPSTQLCSCCGSRKKLKLDERVYTCPICGCTVDRDLNAANNLYTVGLTGINAWGHEGSGYKHTLVVKPPWMIQELNTCSLVGTN